jgi:phospholipase/carboxylesterase
MDKNNKLKGPSYLFNKKPKKLIFLFHGYGDNAENFIPLAIYLNDKKLKINFFAPNATFIVPEYPLGRQWFNPYPNGTHYDEVGPEEKATMQNECENSTKQLKEYINNLCALNNLSLKDCFIIGFSQGAMIAYELGKYLSDTLAGCVMLSGRILSSTKLEKNLFISTPLMIIHGSNDEVVDSKYFKEACKIAKSNGFSFEHYLIEGGVHTISSEVLHLVKNFIKKYV